MLNPGVDIHADSTYTSTNPVIAPQCPRRPDRYAIDVDGIAVLSRAQVGSPPV